MKTKSMILRILTILALLGSFSAAQAQNLTRFEAETVGVPAGVNDAAGFDWKNEVWGIFDTTVVPDSSGGKIVFTTGTTRSLKFLFYGTGVNLITRKANNGGTYDWILDDGVQTGSGSLFSETDQNQASVPIASGLTKSLHTLELRPTLTTAGTVMFVDAFDVIDSDTRYLVDDANAAKIAYAGGWTHGDSSFSANTEAIGGSISYSLTLGDTATYEFTGTSVAILTVPRADSLTVDWDIDNGAYTGTVDPKAANILSFGLWYRWPSILKTGLSDTPHTLKLTVSQKGAGNFIFCLDGIVYTSSIKPPKLYEAEATHTPRTIDDVVGYDLINGVVGEFGPSVIPGSSGDKVLYTGGTARNFKCVFYGTGLNLIARKANNGGTFDWILDEGAQTGSGDLMSAVEKNQANIPIVSGLPLTLHTIEFRATLTTPGTIFFMDAIEVIGDTTRLRAEDDDQTKVHYAKIAAPDADLSAGAGWTVGYAADNSAEEASGGTVSFGRQGDSLTVNFYGTAVGFTFCARPDQQPMNWSIDNGAFTGTVSEAGANALGFGFWHRWPVMLKNDLAPGDHTLTLTVGGSGGVANFDAVDVAGLTVPVELSSFAAE